MLDAYPGRDPIRRGLETWQSVGGCLHDCDKPLVPSRKYSDWKTEVEKNTAESLESIQRPLWIFSPRRDDVVEITSILDPRYQLMAGKFKYSNKKVVHGSTDSSTEVCLWRKNEKLPEQGLVWKTENTLNVDYGDKSYGWRMRVGKLKNGRGAYLLLENLETGYPLEIHTGRSPDSGQVVFSRNPLNVDERDQCWMIETVA